LKSLCSAAKYVKVPFQDTEQSSRSLGCVCMPKILAEGDSIIGSINSQRLASNRPYLLEITLAEIDRLSLSLLIFCYDGKTIFKLTTIAQRQQNNFSRFEIWLRVFLVLVSPISSNHRNNIEIIHVKVLDQNA
jgi:hypothetical protein